jgi:protein-L-isoaspartate(D-aspartate) O-methyltransferase
MNRLAVDGIGMTSRRTRERLVERLRAEGIRNPAVLEAMRSTPRHLFVDEALASRAYDDTALPIGFGQTLSQPYIVARMTEIVLERDDCRRVLEVGTGSGYQAAVLAAVVGRVFTLERIGTLVNQARRRFRQLGIGNVRVKHQDGALGWPEQAPFDAIVVTAATHQVPEYLATQLVVGGRLVLPVGDAGQQRLQIVTRTAEGFQVVSGEKVRFVELISGRA